MARYDVYKNRDGDGYLIELQSDLLDGLSTRMVAPLWPRAMAPQPATRLNPVFFIAESEHVMLTQLMAAVPVSAFGERVDSLSAHADDVTNAIDMLFSGF